MADDGDLIELERKGAVALVSINRPRANVLCRALLVELVQCFAELSRSLPGAVVLTGKGGNFAAGADIAELADETSARLLVEAAGAAFDAVAAFPRVTIAAISGYALGGGLELALACDLRVATNEARLGLPEITLGVFPGAGGTQRLPRLVGAGRAKELIFTGRPLAGPQAHELGLVEVLTSDADALGAALELADRIAAGPVVAQSLAKEAIDRGASLPLQQGLALERELFLQALTTNDARRGITAFLERGPRTVRFSGD